MGEQSKASKPRFRATNCRPRQPKNGPNKTELAYSVHLDLDPEVEVVFFERIKLKLADRTYYTPDFMVLRSDGSLEMHEVKGFWEDDARVKIKVAAEQFPVFRFVAAKKKGGGWVFEEF